MANKSERVIQIVPSLKKAIAQHNVPGFFSSEPLHRFHYAPSARLQGKVGHQATLTITGYLIVNPKPFKKWSAG